MRRIVFFLAIALALGSCGRPDAPASVPTAAPIPIVPAEATVVSEPTPPMANIPPAEAYIPPDAAYPAYPPPTTGIASTPADISLTTVPNQTAAPCSGCTPTPFEATATPNLAFIPPCLAADRRLTCSCQRLSRQVTLPFVRQFPPWVTAWWRATRTIEVRLPRVCSMSMGSSTKALA